MEKQSPAAPRSKALTPTGPTVGRKGGSQQASPHDPITSRDNKWLKAFRAALRGNGPDTGDPIGVEGPKLVEEVVRAGLEAEALLVSETGECDLERILLAASESDPGIPRSRILRTTDKLFASVAGTEAPQGVAALFRPPEWTFEDVLRGAPSRDGALGGEVPLVVVLAGVQDPGNVGTILRSAEAFGATGAIASRGTADPWSPKSVRASAGSALRLPVLRGIALPILLAQLRVAQVRIYSASSKAQLESKLEPKGREVRAKDAEKTNGRADLREASAIFIGSEGHGLPTEVEHASDAHISVPMSEAVESLNAAVAASIVLYEAARQRKLLRG